MPIEPSLLAGDNNILLAAPKGSLSGGPGESNNAATHCTNPHLAAGRGGGDGGVNEDSRRRATEKRAELRREAEKIRQMLAAKERELAELNNDDLDVDDP
jgi:hypothetical protein